MTISLKVSSETLQNTQNLIDYCLRKVRTTMKNTDGMFPLFTHNGNWITTKDGS